jgi:hypothetical protein
MKRKQIKLTQEEATRGAATLSRSEWIEMDQEILRVARGSLRVWADLGLTPKNPGDMIVLTGQK